MTALVDLQAVVWYVHDDRRLGQNAREALAKGAGELLMSSASLWELAIKVSLRKFAIDRGMSSVRAAGFAAPVSIIRRLRYDRMWL